MEARVTIDPELVRKFLATEMPMIPPMEYGMAHHTYTLDQMFAFGRDACRGLVRYLEDPWPSRTPYCVVCGNVPVGTGDCHHEA